MHIFNIDSMSTIRFQLDIQSQWLIHSYLSESPLKFSHNTQVKEHSHRPRSPTWTEGLRTMRCGLVPQGDPSRHCYWLPQCHGAFGMIPSTLAWKYQRLVSQRVVYQTSTLYPLHTCYHLPRDPGYGLQVCVRVAPLRGTLPHKLPSPYKTELRTRCWI
jgi:hypothetical protein